VEFKHTSILKTQLFYSQCEHQQTKITHPQNLEQVRWINKNCLQRQFNYPRVNNTVQDIWIMGI